MSGWDDYLRVLVELRQDQRLRLTPAQLAQRIVNGPFADRFGKARMDRWLEIDDWDLWAGAFTGNGTEELIKRCGLPVMEKINGEDTYIPGTWRGGNWVRAATAPPEPDVSPEQARTLIDEMVGKITQH